MKVRQIILCQFLLISIPYPKLGIKIKYLEMSVNYESKSWKTYLSFWNWNGVLWIVDAKYCSDSDCSHSHYYDSHDDGNDYYYYCSLRDCYC
jgi:hypothetical protein